MASPFSRDILAGAALAHSLDATGSAEEIELRLGKHLVAALLSPSSSRKRKSPATSGDRQTSNKQAAWLQFLRSERDKVVESGYAGRADIRREISRRWALVKQRDGGSAPLALPPPSPASLSSDDSIDGLLQAIRELPAEEIASSLEAHGLTISDDFEVNVEALARTLV